MTAARTAQAILNVSPDDYMATLLTQRRAMKDKVDAANAVLEQYEALKKAIKIEANLRNPDAAVVDIHDPFTGPPLRMSYIVPRRFNKIKAEQLHPGITEACTEDGTGYWELRERV